MFLWLWQFLRGFVTVEVTGFSAERFINMAAHRGVYLWDVTRTPAGVRMNVSIKGFKRLKGCAHKTKCRVKITGKQGCPFILHRYRKRKILLGGAVFFLLALYALSSFIWLIDIRGNERISQEQILSFLADAGLKPGAFKYTLQPKQLQHALIERFPDISWVDVHTKGTRTTVSLAEIIPKQPVVDRSTPCNIVAAKDGLITGIVTGAGKPLVKKYDVVKQGEVLVSGLLELTSDEGSLGAMPVHAYAEVWAKRYTTLSFTIPYDYTEKVYTQRTQKQYALQFLFAGASLINLPGSSIPYENYDKITYRRQPGVSGDYPLPFILVATEYAEFVPEPRTRTLEEAMELADRMVTSRIIREFDFAADIVDKRVDFAEQPDGLLVSALITTNERIDTAVPIN